MALQLTELLPAISFQVLKLTTKLHCISNDSTFPNGIVLQKLPFLKIQGTFGISYNENGLYHSHTKALMLPFAFCTISLLFHKKTAKCSITHIFGSFISYFFHTQKNADISQSASWFSTKCCVDLVALKICNAERYHLWNHGTLYPSLLCFMIW